MTDRRAEALWPARAEPARHVVGLGEISLDIVGTFVGAARFSAKRELASLERRPGGTVATAILGCRRLGLGAGFIGAVGSDADAEEALRPLAEAGVDLSGVERVGGTATRKAFIGVEPKDGARAVYALRPAELDLDTAQLDPTMIREAGALLVDNSDPDAALWAARLARKEHIPVVLDADSAWSDCGRLLDCVDFPVVGEDLARHLAASDDPVDGLRVLVERGARLAVATRGEAGSLAVGPAGAIVTAAFSCRVVDTTGAGDAFRAGFLWALLEGADATSALRFANASGALNCGGPGAQSALPSRQQLEAFVAER